ncbi:DUF1707 SHOCT-like domain-containing protein [Nocardioides hwasunensis]|uniref:DUF1707 domain-containing protein n=1 Tax=Nocardioides hwasunensis TaxID=397258 RepID=A0ABR8MEN5_9ACTN|nr:DUF1707 domain-containing protein [Nocardioides hwasunensis]MBD3914343.1 DUF1707 domain-containing protein [Nocardioides hwasunensis]
MEGFRARDADRERHVGLIEAAYVDGQLGDADRELRVGRALSAETLDELQTLTRDLQLPAGYVAPVDHRPASRSSRRTSVLVALGVVVALIGLVVAAMVVSLAPSGPDADSSGGVVDVAEAPSAPPPSAAPEVRPFEMTAAEIRRFVDQYEAKFGTTDAYVASFFPDRVSVEVPVRGSRPRFERWTWDGEWQRTSGPQAVASFNAIFDLGRLGAKRLVANVAVAERTLGVQRGAFAHATARVWASDGPTVFIHVGNDFKETGFLATNLSGSTIRSRYPYGS